MISILIPIYNNRVIPLVKELHAQCLALKLPFEIICMDDHSEAAYRLENEGLTSFSGVQYIALEENIGRSRIRNRLADLALYPYLLFMDGDSKVVRSDYIRRYTQILQPQKVVYGGRVYSDRPPTHSDYFLHWNYGRQREALLAGARNRHPYRTFMTNNFVVPKVVSTQIQFDESIQRYGYEDNLYALELQQAGIEVLHLDNPLEHIGLEKNEVFLRKTTDALDNLQEIRARHPEIKTRLLEVVAQLESWHLKGPFRWFAPVVVPLLKSILRFPKTPLWVLDLYKLFYFLRSDQNELF